MSQNIKRRGRPKGSKNKRALLSGATVERVCDFHKFNPTVFLLQVANGIDKTEQWTKDDRLRAATKLHDSIHHKRGIPGIEGGEVLDGQFELVFEESRDVFSPPIDIALPSETSTTLAADADGPAPNGRIGLSSPDGENGVCDQ